MIRRFLLLFAIALLAGCSSVKVEDDVLDFPYSGTSTLHLNVDDWMYLIDDKTLLNRSSITKLGFDVASVFISFRKRD